MTLKELQKQLREMGSPEVRVASMYGVVTVRLLWPDGDFCAAVDVDIDEAVRAAFQVASVRRRVS